jgi:hypothetical protein
MGFVFGGNPFSSPNLLVPLVMFAWIPTVIYLFSRFPARKAVVISFLVAWLFLPVAELALPGLPNYTKMSATCYGILLATCIFDVGRFQSFKFSWIDIPMSIWCLCPLASSLTNGLGLYDGLTSVLTQTMIWGVPYFLGRIYFNSLDGLRQLATGIFIAGLIYVPLCLFEIRLSPQLHRILYGGAAGGDFAQSIRFGGYRPSVFMEHGLALGAFMMAATLLGIWLWQSGSIRQLWGFPVGVWVGVLFFTFALIKSTGAYFLLALGVFILLVAKFFRTALPVFLVIAAIGVYLYFNSEGGGYFSDQILDNLRQLLPRDRVGSLEFRFNNEELLVEHARQQPWFGWAGWGRSLLYDETGRQTVVQDSLWVLTLGQYGLVGLVSLFTTMLLPTLVLFWSRCPARLWFQPKTASIAALAVVVVLYVVDCILNAMINPIYILVCGGIAGIVVNWEKARRALRNRSLAKRRYLEAQREF